MQLAGKAALISGAGGGICRAIAVAFAEAGAAVACCDLNPEAAAETARLVTAAGGRALSQVCDVASEAMLTMLPPPARFIAGTAALQQFQMPLTLTAIAASHSASSIASKRPPCSAP